MFTPFFEEMFSVGLPLLENAEEKPEYFYAIGDKLSLFSNAILNRFGSMKPVLLHEKRAALIKARDEMPLSEVMGFIKKFNCDSWKKDLPGSPFLIGVNNFLSRFANELKADLIDEMYKMIRPGGYLVIGDMFIPQTIGLFESYLRQLALDKAFSNEANLTESISVVKNYLHENGKELCLPETMYDLLYDAGFKSVELVYKKMLFGFIVAEK